MVFALDAKPGPRAVEAAKRTTASRSAAAIARTPTRRRRPPPTASGSTRRSAGTSALFCYSMDGTPLWTHTWPPQPRYLDFGTASSPVVHDGRVYQLHDNEGDSFLAALDAKTGSVIWNVTPRTARGGRPRVRLGDAARLGERIAHRDRDDRPRLRDQLRPRRPRAVAPEGHDPGDAQPDCSRTGCCISGSGSQGEANRPLFAVRPDANGDISLAPSEKANEFVAWFQPRVLRLHPVAAGVSRPRLRGQRQRHPAGVRREDRHARSTRRASAAAASPSRARRSPATGRVYFLSEDGDTFVINAGDRYEEVAKNSLGELSLATPAVDARRPLHPHPDEAVSDQERGRKVALPRKIHRRIKRSGDHKVSRTRLSRRAHQQPVLRRDLAGDGLRPDPVAAAA